MTRRIERVNQVLREELANLLLRSAKDPRLESVSIMAVKATSDLKFATVYVRAGGDDAALDEALEGLQSAEGFFREIFKVKADFDFQADRTLEHASRIESLLEEIKGDLTPEADSIEET